MARWEFERGGVQNYLLDLLVRGLFAALNLLPYETSLTVAGWIMARILSPVSGANQRIRKNLRRVWPEMEERELRRLCREVSVNSARLMLENFRPEDFVARARAAEFTGPGKARLLKRLAGKQPVILVSGHFGNFQCVRVLLTELGYPSAGVYRPMNNAYTNRRYVENLAKIAGPNFSRGMKGTKELLKHLRAGGSIALLNDQAAYEGAVLSFMGHPALTMTSAADFARKYQAEIFPCYGIRLENGVDFRVEVEEPIKPGDPLVMTQALNDSLEARVREHPGQWFWMHRRWKTG
jgi:Kdo2-lipid IVA lauroyltransferase/acyltransferase